MGWIDRIVGNISNLCSAPDTRSNSAPVLDSDTISGTNISTKYKLKSKIAKGSFGTTFICKELSTGNNYACKKISKKDLKREGDRNDVRREVGIMRYLPKNKNVIEFKDAFEDERNIYIVMELCKGRDLFKWQKAKGRLDEREAVAIMKSMVDAVKFCHDYGVMHRDLKPENFIFKDKKDGSHLKLIDFGLSITFYPDQQFNDAVGSFSYMAPEVLLSSYGPEADIWSLGIIMYRLLCGRIPFIVTDMDVNFEAEPWPRISRYAKDLLKKMLDMDSKKRLTAQQVLGHRWFKYSPEESEDISARGSRRRRNN